MADPGPQWVVQVSGASTVPSIKDFRFIRLNWTRGKSIFHFNQGYELRLRMLQSLSLLRNTF
jgi:hypothetical protein